MALRFHAAPRQDLHLGINFWYVLL